jgi:hypothetical protein
MNINLMDEIIHQVRKESYQLMRQRNIQKLMELEWYRPILFMLIVPIFQRWQTIKKLSWLR